MYRIGLGHDTHRFTEGNFLRLGGVTIPYSQGLLGHSDADVLLHAVADALLGALNLGDIGEHFSDHDPENKNRNSEEILSIVFKMVQNLSFEIVNIDSIIFTELPKLSPYKAQIAQNIARLLNLPPDFVSVKAKTGEKIGIIGRKEAISAEVIVLLKKSSIQIGER
ncbi:MAG: 2-C-methyl-D-erythritol 2,4-cyclodiphosphate synthase [Planctomycetia bacterium]|nr:2-C-methyl-D-erythritol 2,4-cyclodiphosphate synthase [Planctomycetia bacterium]